MIEEALYKYVAKQLSTEIENYTYKKGDLLPTEAKLCVQFNVSRVTIRQAIQILVEKNYVKKIRGSGTHVIYSHKDLISNRSSKIISFSEEMRTIGKISSAKIIEFKLINADKIITEDLSLSDDAKVIYYERILYGDDIPYCFEIGYMPLDYFPDFTIADLMDSKIKYIEEKKQFKIDYSHQIVHAIMPNKKIQNYLNIDANIPLVEVTHITYETTGIPLEKTIVTFDSNSYQAHFIKKRL